MRSQKTDPSPISVAFFPNWRDNPYLDLLEQSLRSHNVTVHKITGRGPYRNWLDNNRSSLDILHFHWLSYLWEDAALKEAILKCFRFALVLRHAKKLDFKLVWTLHDIHPPIPRFEFIERWLRKSMLHYADAVITHCLFEQTVLVNEFGYKGRVYTCPHGNYIGFYQDDLERDEARRILSINPQGKVLVHIGMLKTYKGIVSLIDAFRKIDRKDYMLLIAGDGDAEFVESLFNQAKGDKRIRIKVGWIDNDQIQLYLRAADAAVFPFQRITTSGSVMLALSFGLPVIVPSLGCLPEMVTQECGIFYDQRIEDSLFHAMLKIGNIELDTMAANALEIARSCSWENSAKSVRLAYDLGDPNIGNLRQSNNC